ncbi:uncharacterized protein LOC110705347 [Chenopodium quinoa]|uniref:uncharacterized protein LOC110705347 n=1 Tax=Chenopodium quinoa TaxID=63459 RepID=UPI000B786ED7|nr:uncharacterized protein LOC110705347 [Chenopodium quinoa]
MEVGDPRQKAQNNKLTADIVHALNQCKNDPSKNDRVIELCSKTGVGPLYHTTLHKSTVLHMACFLKNFKLADKLLDIVFDNDSSIEELYQKLATPKNAWGCTVLHDAATSNKGIPFIEKLLNKVPQLLDVGNTWGESPLLEAIRYGRRRMYFYLVKEVKKYCESKGLTTNERLRFLKRNDNLTILHTAILTRQFDVALDITERYPELYHVQDPHKMTALQMPARSPTAFKSGTILGPLQKLVYSIVSTDEQELQDTTAEVGMIRRAINFIISRTWCICPMIEEVRKLKKGNEDALKLAKKLIEEDTSWENTYMPLENEATAPNIRQTQNTQSSNKKPQKGDDEAPLLLAARKGCIEIVEEILEVYPQAVDYLNHNQENLFHVAVRSRNIEIILNIVSEKNLSRRGQLTAIDKDFNTIMHKVGYQPSIPGKDNENGKKSPTELTTAEVLMDTRIKTPITELSDELSLLEKLEGHCPNYLINHRNKDNLTARELFAKKNADLREKAKEFLKQTAEHCTVVTILIATVAFAAAYTVPGGPDERTGLPVLLGQPLFLVFTVTDVLSLGFGLTAVVVFLTILTSQFRMKDFQRTLPQRLLVGLTLLFLSVSMMMVSFAATIILTINTKQRWTKIALYIVAFFTVIIFMLSYIPFYKELLHILNYCIVRIGRSLPKPTRTQNPKDKDASLNKIVCR